MSCFVQVKVQNLLIVGFSLEKEKQKFHNLGPASQPLIIGELLPVNRMKRIKKHQNVAV